ncbi:MAG: efflux RND transporter periplasmic adaptor subunit [Methylotetracoccus sp.]
MAIASETFSDMTAMRVRWLGVWIMAATLIAGCEKKKPPPPPPMRVNAQQLLAHDIEYVYEYPGVVQGVVDYPVIPRVSGAIFKQLYKEGTLVQKDQPLYEIDRRPYLFALKAFEGQYHKDVAARDNYKIIYDRYASLSQKDVTSVQDVNTALINYQSAVGNVMTDVANIDNAKLNLEYCTVRAPATGYISERAVSPGMMVTAFETQLNVINSQDAMYIAFSMPELDRLDIENGKLDGLYEVPADYRFTVDLELADGTHLPKVGKVEFKDIRVSFSDGVWQLRATIDNQSLPRNKLLAGQFVHVHLRDLYVRKTYALPQEAIFRDHESSYVFVKDGDRARKTRIEAGKYLVDGTQFVDSGLRDGMIVITNGGVRIADNDPVAVDELVKDDGNRQVAEPPAQN